MKGWAHGLNMDCFNCMQQLGRPSSHLGGGNVQLSPCYNKGKPLCKLANAVKMQSMFYPNIVNTLHVFYLIIKTCVFIAILLL